MNLTTLIFGSDQPAKHVQTFRPKFAVFPTIRPNDPHRIIVYASDHYMNSVSSLTVAQMYCPIPPSSVQDTLSETRHKCWALPLAKVATLSHHELIRRATHGSTARHRRKREKCEILFAFNKNLLLTKRYCHKSQ